MPILCVYFFFGKKKKVRDFILAQRTEGEGSIFFNNVGSPRKQFTYMLREGVLGLFHTIYLPGHVWKNNYFALH